MLSDVFEFCLPFLRQMMTRIGPVLMIAATNAVTILAQNAAGLTGASKRDEAFRMITKDLQTYAIQVGIDVSSSMVYAAIEVAYQKLK